MKVSDIIWLPQIVDKSDWKHQVSPYEIEEVLFGKPVFRKVQKADDGSMTTERNNVTERLNQVHATESSELDPAWKGSLRRCWLMKPGWILWR